MNSSVVLVFFFYLTVLNGLPIESDSSVNETSKSDDLIVPKVDVVTIANGTLNASSAAALVASEESTVKPEDLEISNRSLSQQNVTDTPEIAPRIGLDQEHHPEVGFVPSFLKTFRRKRNLAVNEDESNY